MSNHTNNCDCLECATNNRHNKAVNKAHEQYGDADQYEDTKTVASNWLGMKRKQDHADTADQFIGGELWVKAGSKPVTTYNSKVMTAANAIKTYKPGTFIGTVYSFVNNPAMFMTTDNQFVPLETSEFDRAKMDASLIRKKNSEQAIIDAKVKERNEQAYKTNSLYALGVDARNAKDKVVDTVGSAISFGGSFLKYGLILALLVVLYTFFVRYSNAS